jgi:hypothetical protein
MKGQDVVNYIKDNIGRYTNLFDATISITSLSSVGGLATAVTSSAHTLSTGDQAVITGVSQYIDIDSITRDGNIVTVTTLQDNRIPPIDTMPESCKSGITVTIEGADPVEYNGTWQVYTSPDEFTFTFKINSTPTTPATVNGILLVKDFDNYNGRKEVTVIDPTTFTYSVSEESLQTTGDIVIRATNVENVATLERINRIYDKDATKVSQNWLYVLLGNTEVYKQDGTPASDPDGVHYTSENYYYYLVQAFSIVAMLPDKDTVSAGDVSDIARNEVRIALIKTLGNASFDSGLTQAQYEGGTYDGDEALDYEGTLPNYAHTYDFNTKVEINIEDVSVFEGGVPLKEIDVFFDEGLEAKIDY